MRKSKKAAETLTASDLEMQEVYFEDEANRNCIETGKKIICFCTKVEECKKVRECEKFNKYVIII